MQSDILCRALTLAVVCCLSCLAGTAAHAGESRELEALLIWGTNQEKSSDPAHKKVSPETAKDFKKTYKWTNYFVINREQATVHAKKTTTVKMSEHCRLEIKFLGGDRFEIELWGKEDKGGKEEIVISGKQNLPKGDKVVMMGLNENESGWFVLIRHKE